MGGAQADISIVIVTYNRAGMLRNALETLVSQITEDKFSFEVLVIDDGSTDRTWELVREISALVGAVPVRYIYKDHAGEGDSRNRGVAEAWGEWVAFFDDDQLADPRWLAELWQTARERGADFVTGAVKLKMPGSARLQLGPLSRRMLGEKIIAPNSGLHPVRYYNVGAGNVLIRKRLFEKVGLFDVSFRQGVDTDFFWRAEKSGVRLWCSPQASAWHVIPEARLRIPYLKETCLRMGVGNARVRFKYEGALKLVLTTFWRVGVALGRAVPAVLKGLIYNNRPLLLDGRCELWYNFGYVRGSLFFLAPKLFHQKRFVTSLDFQYINGFKNNPSR